MQINLFKFNHLDTLFISIDTQCMHIAATSVCKEQIFLVAGNLLTIYFKKMRISVCFASKHVKTMDDIQTMLLHTS